MSKYIQKKNYTNKVNPKPAEETESSERENKKEKEKELYFEKTGGVGRRYPTTAYTGRDAWASRPLLRNAGQN